MHLHSLTFQAIGPFAGRHHVDLAALGASGIYLLEGPTGAGKSTIIDAIVFALYGKVASDAASDDRLRSAFAGPDVESYVDLVLEVPAGVFRVRRTPEYRRPKKRGTGTTTQQASVRLWRLAEVPPTDAPDAVEDAAGELLSARLDEAGDEIRRLVGLDRRQLVQTVVLPQGEFATFLRAKPEDRAVLLQKVFGTELYHRAAARLAELARAARSRTDAARQGVVGAAERFAGAAGLGPDDARRLREAAPGVHALAVAHVARLDTEAASLAERAAGADATLIAARERFEHERARHDALERRARLRADVARLDGEEAAVAECRRRADAAARAAVVAPAAQGLARADQTLRAALDRLALARTGAPAALADADPTTLEALRADVATAAVRVARLVPVGASLPGRDRELADGRKEVAQATEERGRVLAELDARPARRDALRTRVASLAAAAGELGVLRERADRARAVEEAARQTAALATEAAEAHAERARAAARANEAVEHEARLRAARIAGLAGELAAGLAVGEPCPVCGGAEHPHPAPLAEGHPAVEDVERAERERADAERLLHDVSARAQVLAERCEARRRDADGLTPQEAGQRVADAEELVAAA
ncbi:MAG: AAA family ATPase, partial [Cellulosimicrobium funkei]